MDELKSALMCDEKRFAEHYESIFSRFTDKKACRFIGQEIYWVLLAKFVDRCSEQNARQLQKGFQLRLVEANKNGQFSLGIMHFIRSTLHKCPSIVVHNNNLFVELAHHSLDFACHRWMIDNETDGAKKHGQVTVPTKLAIEIYFMVMQLKQEVRVLTTICALMTKLPPYDFTLVLPLEVMKKAQAENGLIASFVWKVYAGIIELSEAGADILLFEFASVFECSLSSANSMLVDASLGAFQQVCRATGFGFCRVSNQMLARLVNLPISDELKWKVMRIMNDLLGVGSLISPYFPQLVALLIQSIRNEESPSKELVLLVISLMNNSLPMLNFKCICELQCIICAKALAWNPTTELLRLLNALLEFNHDEVPLPLQIAPSVFYREYSKSDHSFLEQVDKGRSLCNLLSRPKMPSILLPLNSDVSMCSSSSIANGRDERTQEVVMDKGIEALMEEEEEEVFSSKGTVSVTTSNAVFSDDIEVVIEENNDFEEEEENNDYEEEDNNDEHSDESVHENSEGVDNDDGDEESVQILSDDEKRERDGNEEEKSPEAMLSFFYPKKY